MMIELQRQLRGEEGEVLTAYQDHLGFWTIGVGRLIDARKGGGLSKDESAYLLSNDITKRMALLDKAIPWWNDLNEPRQAVLLQMAFQMGVDGLLGFKNTLALIKGGDYAGGAAGMLGSKWAQQTPGRAGRLAEQMRTGQWVYKPGT